MASHAPFNEWGNGNRSLLFFLHLVDTICYLRKIKEPFFEEKVNKVVILINLGVHGELGV